MYAEPIWVAAHPAAYHWFIARYGFDRRKVRRLPSHISHMAGISPGFTVIVLNEAAWQYCSDVVRFLYWRGAKFICQDEFEEVWKHWRKVK